MNKMPDTTIIEPMVEEVEINELQDIKKIPKPSPFVDDKPKQLTEVDNINLTMLNKKKLCDMCKSKGYRGYSKLTKPNLIKLLNGESIEDILMNKPKPKKPKKTLDIDIETEKVEPKEEKLEPKVPIKNKEKEPTKELQKEEPLIKHEPVEPPPKPIPRPQPTPSPPPKKVVVEEPVVKPVVKQIPKPQPQPHISIPPKQEKLYNPFRQLYNIN